MIVEKELFMTKLNETRKIFIYLPDDYETSNKQYPVLYAFDGHNIIFRCTCHLWQGYSYSTTYRKARYRYDCCWTKNVAMLEIIA